MSVKFAKGSWGQRTEVQGPMSKVQSPAEFGRADADCTKVPIVSIVSEVSAQVADGRVHKICNVIFGDSKEAGFRGNMKVCYESYDNSTNLNTRFAPDNGLTRSRSALAGFWLRPDSFRRLPGGSSPLISVRGKGVKVVGRGKSVKFTRFAM